MARKALDGVLQHIRKLAAVQTNRELGDGELLERFVQAKDETAFTALVERHGPMVLRVCRRALQNEHDAEDACQVAFLVLSRHAPSVRKGTSLSSWLHGVAARVAANLKRERLRRCRRERQGNIPVPADPPAEVSWREVREALDEELQGLPEPLRIPLVLCYLDGRTRDEAARQLGISVGCLHGRLQRGRKRLCDRLTRRGIALSAALLATALGEGMAQAALSPAVVLGTVKAALQFGSVPPPEKGLISAKVVSLAHEVFRNMALTRLKIVAVLVLVAGTALAGVGVLTGLLPGAKPAMHGAQAEPSAEGPAAEGGGTGGADRGDR